MALRNVKQAILDRLSDDVELAGAVFEGLVSNPPQRYVAVFTNSGVRRPSRLTGPSTTTTQTFFVHSVGSTPDQAQYAAEHVFTQLLDWTPTIAGLNCRRMSHESSQPTARDDDVTPPLYFCVDEFDLVFEAL